MPDFQTRAHNPHGAGQSKGKEDSVEPYLNDELDYAITVCGGANEAWPAFLKKRSYVALQPFFSSKIYQ